MKQKPESRRRKGSGPARRRAVSAAAIDRLHDAGGSIAAHLDMSSARRTGAVVRRVNVDFPEWMVAELDREAEHLGVTRQSVIKVFIAERLKAARSA
jgi:hypothetical protein